MKKMITDEIFRKSFNGDNYDVRISDLPKDLTPDDIIDIQREESFFSENNSYDAYTVLCIYREREETDEEYTKRKEESKKLEEDLKQRRYATYLKLKTEFEK
jgi:hypothetical protein